MWLFYRKRIIFLIVFFVVLLLAVGMIVFRAKLFSSAEPSQDSSPGFITLNTEDLRKPPSWQGRICSFAAAAGYREKDVRKIELYDGLSGKTVLLTSPEEIKTFFRIFDGVNVSAESLQLVTDPDISQDMPVGVTVWQGDSLLFFVFGDSAVAAPYEEKNTMIYLSEQKIGLNLNIRRRYGWPEDGEVYTFGETETLEQAAGFHAAEIDKIELMDGATGRAATLQTAEEIQEFLSALSEVPVTLKKVGFFDGYTIGVTLYRGEETVSFSFGDDYLKVPAGLPGSEDKMYTLTLPENTSQTILETYDFQ